MSALNSATLTTIVATTMAAKYVPSAAYLAYQLISAFAPNACKYNRKIRWSFISRWISPLMVKKKIWGEFYYKIKNITDLI